MRSTLTLMMLCFSLHLAANEGDSSDLMPVNEWGEPSAETASENRFDPARMFENEEDETEENHFRYDQYDSPYGESDFNDESGDSYDGYPEDSDEEGSYDDESGNDDYDSELEGYEEE